MKLLIDTHVLIWWLTDPTRLSSRCRDILASDDAEVLVSAVSAYEIEFKRSVDPVLQKMPEALVVAVVAEGFDWRAIEPEDAVVAGGLPRHHRDPWDRLLIAQAIVSGLPILTKDTAFSAYGVPTLW
jgi:PIN domain nuclease of toxin-antitoxin system